MSMIRDDDDLPLATTLAAVTIVAALLLTLTGCGGALAGGTIGGSTPIHGSPTDVPKQFAAWSTFDVIACGAAAHGDHCDAPIGGVLVKVHTVTNPDTYDVRTSNADGYTLFSEPESLVDSDITFEKDGYLPQTVGVRVKDLVGQHNIYPLYQAHVDPSGIPLEQLAAIRGAMWPLGTASTCGALPLGPRPGAADNVIATVFITEYSAEQQDCIIAELKARGYTHVVMGPLVDSDGYHGIWTPNDWRGANFDRFLDAAQKFWDAGLAPIVFISPDGWTYEQNVEAFTPLLQQPRAQRLIRLAVPHGWEPARYGSSSCTWALFGQWIRETLPNALVLIHTESDVDAPVGTDARCNDDDRAWNPGGNAAGWGRVTPFYHGWLTQSGAFNDPTGTGGDREHPELTNFQNWQRQFDPTVRGSYRDRFEHGYAGWPRGSAWGPDQPLRVYAGEYDAYWKFWQHRTEAEGAKWGDAAIAAGAAGYLDSGSVLVRR